MSPSALLPRRRTRIQQAAVMLAVPPGFGRAAARVAAIIPVTLLVIFVAPLWPLGLLCGKDRRRYVTGLTERVLRGATAILQGGAGPAGTAAGQRAGGGQEP